MIQDGDTWRPPAVNETCCARPQLAATLQRIAESGPDAVYTGEAGQVWTVVLMCMSTCQESGASLVSVVYNVLLTRVT